MQGVIGSTPISSTTERLPQKGGLSSFMEQFYVYILFSPSLNRHYIGHTGQLSDRLFRHTNSGSKSTKAANDWKLVYSESYSSRSEAMKQESHIKKQKSRKFIQALIQSQQSNQSEGAGHG